MTQQRLFGRTWAVTLRTTRVTNLRVAFVVEKSLAPAANKMALRVWNMAEVDRNVIGTSEQLPVQIVAGYQSGASTIFLGNVRNGRSKYEPSDVGWVTEVTAGDAEAKIRKARVASAFAPGSAKPDAVIRRIASSIGVSYGNLDAAVASLKSLDLWPSGTVIFGSARRELSLTCLALNKEWSIQDGALQILDRGKVLAGEALFLTPQTGLLGTPTVDAKRIATIRCAMIPDVVPGRLVVVRDEALRGQFRIEKTVHKGDSHGSEWEIEITGSPY